MQVAVRNNSLDQTIALIGTAYTGAIVACLISVIPIGITRAEKTTLQISVEFGDLNVRIKFAFSDSRACFSQFQLPRGVKGVQSIIESRALIHGLILFVLGIMPTQTVPPFLFAEVLEATALGLLFDWEERSNPLIRKRSFALDAIDFSLMEQYILAAATAVTPSDAKKIDALLKEVAEEEPEVESPYRRKLEI